MIFIIFKADRQSSHRAVQPIVIRTVHWRGLGKKMKIVVCNTEWASSQKQEKLNDIIFSFDPDIVCATEVKKDFFLKEGNIIFSESDYGYKTVNKYKGNYSAPKIPDIMQDFQQRQVLQLQRRLSHVFLLSRYKNGF